MRWLALAAIARLGLGCGTPHTPAPKDHAAVGDGGPEAAALDQDLPKLAARSLKMFEDLAKTFAAVGENCDTATTKLAELTKTYADVVAATAKIQHDGRDMQLKLALRQYEQELDAAAKSIMSSKTLPACAENAAFQRAFAELGGTPPG